MRKFEGKRKLLSVLLCLCMVLGYLPTPTAAAENGLCAHHETHDEECGYVEAVEGQDCNHQCNNDCGEKNVCTHNCETDGCTLVPAVEKVDCDHQCDGANCAWRAAVPEVKCTCGAKPAHTAECASLTAEGADCDCGMPISHTAECAPQPAVDGAECDHDCANGGCSYVAPVDAYYDCQHVHDDSCVEKYCAHVCPEDNCGFVAAAGSDCSYALNGCAECEEEAKKIADGPQVLTISAWSWNDEYEILSADGTYATLPNAADWEALKSVLPASITAMVGSEEVEIPVQWECETFPTEGVGQGTYELKAILPEGYVMGEGVAALELEVDLGVAEQLIAHEHTWDSYTGTCSGCDMTHDTHGAYTWTEGKCSVCSIVGGYCGYVYEENTVEYVLTSADQGSTYTITISGTGKMGEYNTASYDATNQPWKDYCKKITTAVVMSGVQDVGWGAFQNHTALTSVSIPNSITKIGSMAFSGTTSLHSITLPSALTSLGSNAFYGSGIQSITIPTGVTQISYNTFQKSKLSSINLGNVTTINTSAFQDCKSLTSISLPSTLTTIGTSAFAGSNLTSVTIPASVTKIGERAFQGCNSLKTVTISGGDLTVMRQAFWSDNALETLTITNTGAVSLGQRAFGIQQNTTDKLNSITLPANVTYYNNSYTDVFEYRNIPAESVSLNKSALTLYTGGSETLIATVLPAEATNKNVTWSSSANGVATVDQTGKVTGIAEGTATITATTVSGGYTATCTVTVLPHAHDWNYETKDTNSDLVNDTITATCNASNCPTPNGGSVTIAAPTDLVYSNTRKDAELSYSDDWELGDVTINYNDVNRVNVTGQDITASITLTDTEGQKIASVTYQIQPRIITADMVKLNPASDNPTSRDPVAYVYDGTMKTVTVEVKYDSNTALTENDYTVSGTTSETALSTGEGYAVTVEGKGNYKTESPITMHWKITKATPNVTVWPTVGEITYGETLADATLTGGVASVEGTFAFQDKTIAPTVDDSNSTEYTLVFTPTDTENYDPAETKVKVTVNPKPVTVTITPNGGTYGNVSRASAAVTGYVGETAPTVTLTYTGTTNAGAEYNSTEVPTEAGTYTVTATISDGNYALTDDTDAQFVVARATKTDKPVVTPVNETVAGLADGKITGLTTAMEYKADGNDTYTPVTDANMTFAAGTYQIRYAQTANYEASEAVDVTIGTGIKLKVTVPATQTGYTLTVDKSEVNCGDNAVLTYTLLPGYTEGTDFAVKVNGAKVELAGGKYTISNITEDTYITVEDVADTTPATATVTMKETTWNKFLETITFGIYSNENLEVKVVASDAGSGVKSVEYFKASAGMTLDQVEANTNWSPMTAGSNGSYTTTITKQDATRFVCYIRVTDNAGKVSYFSTDGAIFDTTAPAITGVTNGGTYYTTQKAATTDTNSDSFTLDGTDFTGTIPGNPSAETSYEIKATDKAENTATVTITMKPIASLDDTIEDLTVNNVTLADKQKIEAVQTTVEDILEHESANATDTEKKALKDIADNCDKLLAEIAKAQAVIDAIKALPDPSKVEPDNKKHIDAYDAAQAAYDALSDNGKKMVDSTQYNKDDLAAVKLALSKYLITEGDGGKWTKGSYKSLSFTANGYYADYGSYAANAYGKFTHIEIDGKTVSADNYTAKAGSTIITLKASYLNTLSLGKHTIQVFYIDGATNIATFRINSTGSNPSTGDNSHMMLFGGVAMTSLLCMAMMIVFFPRKKGKYQR